MHGILGRGQFFRMVNEPLVSHQQPWANSIMDALGTNRLFGHRFPTFERFVSRQAVHLLEVPPQTKVGWDWGSPSVPHLQASPWILSLEFALVMLRRPR